jgi:hypothetical protein
VSNRPWWNLEPCGTSAAYKRHIRHREVPCEPCRQFERAKSRARIAAMRAETRRRHADQQARIDALLTEVIAILADALAVRDRSSGARQACWRCHRRICRCAGVQAARRAA